MGTRTWTLSAWVSAAVGVGSVSVGRGLALGDLVGEWASDILLLAVAVGDFGSVLHCTVVDSFLRLIGMFGLLATEF